MTPEGIVDVDVEAQATIRQALERAWIRDLMTHDARFFNFQCPSEVCYPWRSVRQDIYGGWPRLHECARRGHGQASHLLGCARRTTFLLWRVCF